MDTETDSVALLSIKPSYVEKILTGEKTVEFRKRAFKRNIRYVLIYSTLPVGKVVGYFEINQLISDSPDRLWKLFSKRGGIEKQAFDDYFSGKSRGIGITIKKVDSFDRPIPLNTFTNGHPPQDFAYLPLGLVGGLFTLSQET